MIRINLLPHREEKRKQREKSFYALLVFGAIAGLLVIVGGGGIIEGLIARQEGRNSTLKTENKRLDEQIKEIATLKEEIESLKARQQAVEDLQADRNEPVYLMDELVKHTPEGVYLKSLSQKGQRVTLAGYAHSNERVAEYLRNLSNHSIWLEKPELIEIKASSLGAAKSAKPVFEFGISVGIKRPHAKDSQAAKGVKGGASVPAKKPASAASAKP